MPEIEEYKEWLSSTPTDVALVDCIILSHPNFPNKIRAVNWAKNIQARYQTTATQWVKRTFTRARFEIQRPQVEDSLAQQTALSISMDDGSLYDIINNMTYDERAQPISLQSLQYLDNDFNTPLITFPYPTWTIGSFSANYESYSVELTVPQLRVRRIGRYFTARELPVLVYL